MCYWSRYNRNLIVTFVFDMIFRHKCENLSEIAFTIIYAFLISIKALRKFCS